MERVKSILLVVDGMKEGQVLLVSEDAVEKSISQ
jgi:hypothetical protein